MRYIIRDTSWEKKKIWDFISCKLDLSNIEQVSIGRGKGSIYLLCHVAMILKGRPQYFRIKFSKKWKKCYFNRKLTCDNIDIWHILGAEVHGLRLRLKGLSEHLLLGLGATEAVQPCKINCSVRQDKYYSSVLQDAVRTNVLKWTAR